MKAALLVLAFIASGLSWPWWMIRGGYRDFLGLSETNVQQAYLDLETRGNAWHKLKNLSSEWCRSGEERASKTLAALILWPWLAAVIVMAW